MVCIHQNEFHAKYQKLSSPHFTNDKQKEKEKEMNNKKDNCSPHRRYSP
jgi:hypothetical protein